MNKAEWAEVEKRLKIVARQVRLLVDGYELRIALLQESQFKNAIVVFINGELPRYGKDSEERRRFARLKTIYKWDSKSRREMKKMGKKTLKMLGYNPEETIPVYLPYWKSFSSLRKHLLANNESFKRLPDYAN